MADWCLFCKAVDWNGVSYSMSPSIIFVNVPDKIILKRWRLFRFLLRNGATKKDLNSLKSITTSRGYWQLVTKYSLPVVKILVALGFLHKYYRYNYNLISLIREIPEDLKKGFAGYGIEYLIGFYDWAGDSDQKQMRREFAIRHPELTGSYLKDNYLVEITNTPNGKLMKLSTKADPRTEYTYTVK